MNVKETVLALATGVALLITAPVYAGGPVIIEEDTALVAPANARKTPGWLLPVLGLAVIAIIASNGGSDSCTTDETPSEPGC